MDCDARRGVGGIFGAHRGWSHIASPRKKILSGDRTKAPRQSLSFETFSSPCGSEERPAVACHADNDVHPETSTSPSEGSGPAVTKGCSGGDMGMHAM